MQLTLLGVEVDFDGGVAARVVDLTSVNLRDGHDYPARAEW